MAIKIKFNSLVSRLIIVPFLIFLPTITIGWLLTSNAIFDNIRAERIKDVGYVASAKHAQLVMVLNRANTRAGQFLNNLSIQCNGNAVKQNQTCATGLIRSYMASEGATGATLRRKGSDSLSIGTSATRNEESVTFQTGQLARFSGTGPDNNRSYFVLVADESAGLQLEITYPSSMLEPVFVPYPAELGISGETFLADGEGYFVTKPKYTPSQGHGRPVTTDPMQSCLSGQSREALDLDYRGVAIIHAFRFIPELGSACIKANIDQDEAFAPLKLLKQRLLMVIFLFGATLAITVVYLGKSIVKPITRLTKVTRTIAAGDIKAKADVTGSDEISELAASFNLMTDHLRAAQQHEAEALSEFRMMLDTSGEGFWKVDQSGRIVEANDAYCQISGYAMEEIIGAHISKFEAAEQTPEDVAAHIQRIVERGYERYETQHRHRDGHLVDIEVITSFIPETDCLIAILRDVTGRKRNEQAMRVAATAFETQDAIMITDTDANILRVNRAFEELSGYSAEELIGRNPRIFKSGQHDEEFYQAMWSDLLGTGKWIGEVWNKRKSGEIYPVRMTITAVYDDHHQVTHYVSVSRDISQRKLAEQQIQQLAFYDPLTNLPNRRLLQDRLRQAFAISNRSGQHGALMFLDLDHFKILNDTQGHDIGDLLLLEVARRLESSVRSSDTVARLGGDEFVVVMGSLSSITGEAAAQAELVAEKVRTALNRPYLLGDYTHRTTPSIGIVLFRGHQDSLENLLKYADTAMYQAKSAGRNSIRFYDPDMQAAIEARSRMEGELHLALEKQQFRLHYQIQVDSLRRPLGAEALLRWEHPERGLVSPMQFIPLTEETGLIVPIGLWVMQTACAQLKAWQHNASTRDLVIAVNVSARQFHQADFVAQVQRVLLESGAEPSHLKLELTESTVLKNVEDTIAKMQEIKKLGVNFSMDDFGTGYSSLQYLKRLPLDQIKIDRSFVSDIDSNPNDAAIVQTIIAMTHALGLNVIAEGVETEAQRDFLDKHGCHAFQGYLFGKPVPIEQFEALLGRQLQAEVTGRGDS